MNKARTEATKDIVTLLSKFAGKTTAVTDLEEMVNGLTDKQFDGYMEAMLEGEETLPYVVPNLGKVRLSVEKNLKIAEELKHDFFEQLWLTDPATGEVHLTPEKYLVIDLPLKRLQQHLEKKMRIPDDNSRIDELTGQPSGASKGSRISFPELQVMYSQGLDKTIEELFKFRGGDEEAYKALSREILSGGVASMSAVDPGDTRARSTDVLQIMLKSAHLNNNL